MKKNNDRELKRNLKLVRHTIRALNADRLDEVHGASSSAVPPQQDGGCSFTRELSVTGSVSFN